MLESPLSRDVANIVLRTRSHAPVSPLPPIVPQRSAAELSIPTRYQSATLCSTEITPALTAVRDFLASDMRQCLVLSGPTGCGKTYAAIAGLITSAFRSKRFCFYPEACDRLLSFRSREETVEQLSRTRLLVLDDFGAGAYPLATTGWTDQTIGGLFDGILTTREANLLPTILTTNLTGPQLSERLSDRLKSRLSGQWAALRVVTGPDLRRAN